MPYWKFKPQLLLYIFLTLEVDLKYEEVVGNSEGGDDDDNFNIDFNSRLHNSRPSGAV